MPKTKIYWFVYVFIGAFVSIVSYFTDRDQIRIFIYVGYLLIAVGVIKLVINLLGKERKPKETKQAHPAPQFQKPVHQKTAHGSIIHCPNCKNQIRNFDNFCSHCGQPLRV